MGSSFQDCYAVFHGAAGKGYDACIAVDRDGLKEAARVAKEAGVTRFVLVSAQLADPINKTISGNKTIRGFLNTINTGMFHYEGLMDFKFQGENFLKESNQTYTIVRPGRLTDGGELGSSGKLMVGQTNGALGKSPGTSRADVARVCAASVFSPNTENVTFELGSDNTMPTQTTKEELEDLFKDFKKDE